MKITAKRISKSLHSLLFVLIAVFFLGCGKSQNPAIDTRQNETKTIQMQVQADIGLLALGGQSVEYVATPPKYKPGDNLITYEGPGWESQMVGYRLYLDGRNAIDVFGKKTADMILKQVGRGDDYHQMQPWGMDILKVGSSLGSGGFGVHENGEAVQIGPAAQFSAQILKNGPQMSIVEVNHSMRLLMPIMKQLTYSFEGIVKLNDSVAGAPSRRPGKKKTLAISIIF